MQEFVFLLKTAQQMPGIQNNITVKYRTCFRLCVGGEISTKLSSLPKRSEEPASTDHLLKRKVSNLY